MWTQIEILCVVAAVNFVNFISKPLDFFCTHSYSHFNASLHKLFKSIKCAINRSLLVWLSIFKSKKNSHTNTHGRKFVHIWLTTELTRIQVNYSVIDRSGHFVRWVCSKWKIDIKWHYSRWSEDEITRDHCSLMPEMYVCISNVNEMCQLITMSIKNCMKFKRFTQMWLIVIRNCDKIVDLYKIYNNFTCWFLVWRLVWKKYTKINLPQCYGLFSSRFSFLLREKNRRVFAIQILLNNWTFNACWVWQFSKSFNRYHFQ